MKFKSKSLAEFYSGNRLYSQSINEGFFGELFKGILKAFAALFGIEIDENANNSQSSSNNRFEQGARDALDSGKFSAKDLKLPDDTDIEKLNWKDFDPESAPDEKSKQFRIELRDSVMAEVLRIELEGVSKGIAALDEVPAFLEGVDDKIVESKKIFLLEQSDQYQKYEKQIALAGAALGQIIGVSRFVNEKIPEFEFTELGRPQTPGDLVQQASYYAFKLEPRGRDNTDEPRKIIDFGDGYSAKNNFSIQLDSPSHIPSKSVKGEKGEAIEDASKESEKELTSEEIEELDPSDYILLDDNELPDLPKDGISNSLASWYDSLSPTSKASLKIGNKIDQLTDGIFTAIDKSVETITKEVEDAIGLWRDENEEALISSKRFAKKNFDSLQDLVPKMVDTILRKKNESSRLISRVQIRSFVNKFLDSRVKNNLHIFEAAMDPQGGDIGAAGGSNIPSSGASVELKIEADDEQLDPEKEGDPTDEVKSASKMKISAKDAIAQTLDSWGQSLSPTSQDTLKRNLKGDSLKDIIFTAVDGASEIVAMEVKRAIKDWRKEHEEALIRSKRFAKKNFDSLEELVPELVSRIIKKTNESGKRLTVSSIRKAVFYSLDKNFYHRNLISESRWQKLAGL